MANTQNTSTRFVCSFSALRDAKAQVARLNAKYEGTGKTFDWGTLVFTKRNPAPKTRPYVVFCREVAVETVSEHVA